METPTDWAAWSREAVRRMQERTEAFVERYALAGRAYDWDLEQAELVFPDEGDEVVADLRVIGSLSSSEGTFLWSWSNEAIPPKARQGIEAVRDFGLVHDLGLLTTAEWAGGRAEALEMAAVAGRVLDAEGIWVAPLGDVTLFFALLGSRRR